MHARAIIMLVLVNALWGLSFPVMKSLNLVFENHFQHATTAPTIPLLVATSAGMVAIRFAFALTLFLIFARSLVRSARRAEWLAGAAIGSFFFTGLILQIIGLTTIPASRSGFLTSLAVVFTPIVSSIAHARRPALPVWLSIGVALFGVSILTELLIWTDRGPQIAPDAMQVWTTGDTLTSIGAMVFSIQIVLVDRLGKRLNSAAFTPGMFATVTLLAATTFCITQPLTTATHDYSWTELAMAPSVLGLIAFLSIFSSLLAFSWMNTYQPFVSAVQAAVIYTLEPVFASAWAAILPGLISALCAIQYANESITWPIIIGGSLVLAANVLALWPTDSASANELSEALPLDESA